MEEEFRAYAEDATRELVDRVREGFPDLEVTSEVVEDTPASRSPEPVRALDSSSSAHAAAVASPGCCSGP